MRPPAAASFFLLGIIFLLSALLCSANTTLLPPPRHDTLQSTIKDPTLITNVTIYPFNVHSILNTTGLPMSIPTSYNLTFYFSRPITGSSPIGRVSMILPHHIEFNTTAHPLANPSTCQYDPATLTLTFSTPEGIIPVTMYTYTNTTSRIAYTTSLYNLWCPINRQYYFSLPYPAPSTLLTTRLTFTPTTAGMYSQGPHIIEELFHNVITLQKNNQFPLSFELGTLYDIDAVPGGAANFTLSISSMTPFVVTSTYTPYLQIDIPMKLTFCSFRRFLQVKSARTGQGDNASNNVSPQTYTQTELYPSSAHSELFRRYGQYAQSMISRGQNYFEVYAPYIYQIDYAYFAPSRSPYHDNAGQYFQESYYYSNFIPLPSGSTLGTSFFVECNGQLLDIDNPTTHFLSRRKPVTAFVSVALLAQFSLPILSITTQSNRISMDGYSSTTPNHEYLLQTSFETSPNCIPGYSNHCTLAFHVALNSGRQNVHDIKLSSRSYSVTADALLKQPLPSSFTYFSHFNDIQYDTSNLKQQIYSRMPLQGGFQTYLLDSIGVGLVKQCYRGIPFTLPKLQIQRLSKALSSRETMIQHLQAEQISQTTFFADYTATTSFWDISELIYNTTQYGIAGSSPKLTDEVTKLVAFINQTSAPSVFSLIAQHYDAITAHTVFLLQSAQPSPDLLPGSISIREKDLRDWTNDVSLSRTNPSWPDSEFFFCDVTLNGHYPAIDLLNYTYASMMRVFAGSSVLSGAQRASIFSEQYFDTSVPLIAFFNNLTFPVNFDDVQVIFPNSIWPQPLYSPQAFRAILTTNNSTLHSQNTPHALYNSPQFQIFQSKALHRMSITSQSSSSNFTVKSIKYDNITQSNGYIAVPSEKPFYPYVYILTLNLQIKLSRSALDSLSLLPTNQTRYITAVKKVIDDALSLPRQGSMRGVTVEAIPFNYDYDNRRNEALIINYVIPLSPELERWVLAANSVFDGFDTKIILQQEQLTQNVILGNDDLDHYNISKSVKNQPQYYSHFISEIMLASPNTMKHNTQSFNDEIDANHNVNYSFIPGWVDPASVSSILLNRVKATNERLIDNHFKTHNFVSKSTSSSKQSILDTISPSLPKQHREKFTIRSFVDSEENVTERFADQFIDTSDDFLIQKILSDQTSQQITENAHFINITQEQKLIPHYIPKFQLHNFTQQMISSTESHIETLSVHPTRFLHTTSAHFNPHLRPQVDIFKHTLSKTPDSSHISLSTIQSQLKQATQQYPTIIELTTAITNAAREILVSSWSKAIPSLATSATPLTVSITRTTSQTTLRTHAYNGLADADEVSVDCGGPNAPLCPVLPPLSQNVTNFMNNDLFFNAFFDNKTPYIKQFASNPLHSHYNLHKCVTNFDCISGFCYSTHPHYQHLRDNIDILAALSDADRFAPEVIRTANIATPFGTQTGKLLSPQGICLHESFRN